MVKVIRPVQSLYGTVALPADKSVAHRAALISAISDGASAIVGYSDAADPQSTLSSLRQLGVRMATNDDGVLVIEGRGLRGFREPTGPIDCGNSGTTMRLLAGLLAGQEFSSTLLGDESLSRRPMTRIAAPLRQMGADIEMTDDHAPITVRGSRNLKGITYELPVASAQVKSCVLLAGLLARGETTVIERAPSRDHTERMLGLNKLEMNGRYIVSVTGDQPVKAQAWMIPKDFSAAAFFVVAALIVPGSEVILENVGLNPSRTRLLDVLQGMGGDITIDNEGLRGGEPTGDITVRSSQLFGVSVSGDDIPALIDEIPVLAVAAACAEGRTEIRDAAELRVKETDRINAMATNLRAMGVDVEEFEDGLSVAAGPRLLKGAALDSFGDHRIAMATAIAGLVAEGETKIRNAGCVDISFPGFWEVLRGLTREERAV